METVSEPIINPRKLALTNALIWAFINIALFLIVYYVKPELMGSLIWGGVLSVIGIALAIYFIIDMRKKIGGYWSFRQALSSIFILFFIQATIVFLFTIVFGKYIEPEYMQRMKEISINSTTQLLEKIGMDQDKIDEALAVGEAEMEKQFNPGFKDLFVSVCGLALMYFIGALIFAAIFKKDPPVFIQSE